MQNPTPTFFRSIVLVAGIGLITVKIVFAQDPFPSATPLESPPPISLEPPPVLELDTCTAAISFSNGELTQLRSTSDVFPLISAGAGETLNVQLRFPLTLVGAEVLAQPLDGGTVSPEQVTVGLDGAVSFQVQLGGQPGLYRFLLNTAGQLNRLEFSVPNPEEPLPSPSPEIP